MGGGVGVGALGVLVGGVRGRVVEVLAEGRWLPARRVFIALRRRGARFSYQAVHKALRKLEAEGIAGYSKEGFFLSREWAQEVVRQLAVFEAKLV